MGRFQKTTCISAAPARATAVRQYIAELGETDPKRHSAVGKSGNQKLRYCMCDQNEIPGTILDLAVFKIVL